MKTYALYGLILAVICTLITLISYFTGLQTDHLSIGVYVQWLAAIAHFVIIHLGLKEERESRPDQRMSYGSALWGAVVISIVAGLLNGAYAYIHFSRINPDFGEYMISYQQAKMTAAGMPDNVVERATANMQNSFGPVRQAVIGCIGTIIGGFIWGLMLAPGQTQRGSITRITVVNGAIFGVLGLLGGAGSGFLYKTLVSSALIGLIGCGGGTALVTYLLLKYTGYTPRFAGEEST